MKTISKTVSPSQQSVAYAEVLDADGVKLRIHIKSDAYDFQSHARIEAFSPAELKWNNIAFIPHAAMKTPHKLVYQPNGNGLREANFTADRNELVRQAAAILDLASPEPEPEGPGRRR